MRHILRLFIISLLSVSLFGIASTRPVYACSGGSPTPLTELIDDAEIIVQGRIVEIDDANNNFIVQIDTYLKGNGAEHLLVALYSPANTLNDMYRPDEDCWYPPYGLYEGMTLLQFLNRRNDGAYVWSPHGLFDNAYYTPDEEITYLSHDETFFTVTYDEFLTVIQDIVGTSPVPPNTDSPYPMLAPLLITTKSGIHYLYPIDKQAPIQISDELLSLKHQLKTACWERNCKAWSGNGLYHAELNGDGHVILNPNLGTHRIEFERVFDAIVFSPSNDALAGLTISRYGVEVQIILFYEYGLSVDELWGESTVMDADEIIPNHLIWNPDGRMIAFSDNRGAWLWDVFTRFSSPRLLAVTDISIHHFSPLGRYVTIGANENGFSVDTINRQILPAGVFSPNEQYLVLYGANSLTIPVSPHLTPINIDRVGSVAVASLPALYDDYLVTQIHWISSHRYLVQVCAPDNRDECGILPFAPHPYTGGFNSYENTFFSAYDFAVHPQTGDIVIVTGRTTLSFDMNQTQYDLSDWLDSPIASIEWLPSLFYDED
ncbi:MAG: hypothetical protein MUE54_03580 [Anaerolineae bacterium]|jgi:hypothetical protein|nr:hypothetical protein [Anaerolineae bacterium]